MTCSCGITWLGQSPERSRDQAICVSPRRDTWKDKGDLDLMLNGWFRESVDIESIFCLAMPSQRGRMLYLPDRVGLGRNGDEMGPGWVGMGQDGSRWVKMGPGTVGESGQRLHFNVISCRFWVQQVTPKLGPSRLVTCPCRSAWHLVFWAAASSVQRIALSLSLST